MVGDLQALAVISQNVMWNGWANLEAKITWLYLDSFITKLFKYFNTKLLFFLPLSIVLSKCTPLLRTFKEKTQFPVMKDKNKQTRVRSCKIAIDILRDDDKKLNTFSFC